MSKKLATINVSKINKNNIKSRTFTTNEGVEMEAKELDIELIDLKEPKVLFEKGDKKLVKVGFITEASFKDASGQWKNGTTLGDIKVWEDKRTITDEQAKEIEQVRNEYNAKVDEVNEISAEEIPF
jgi:hypothetical protein